MSVFSVLMGYIDDGFTAVANEFRKYHVFLDGSNSGNFAALPTTSQNVSGALAELLDAIGDAGGSDVATLDDLTDVVITLPVTGHMVRYDGAHFVNVDPTTYLQPRDAQLDVWAGIDLDIDGTLAANSDAKVASQKAIRTYFAAQIAALNVQVFKGTIDASANPNYPAADAGATYVVSVAGKIGGAAGVAVEAGDVLLCLVDNTATGAQAAVGANWDVIQTNLIGAVTGPAGATDGRLAAFDGVTGKIIKDSGAAISTDGTFAANSDAKVPTEKAIGTYIGSAGGHSFADTFNTALTAP